MSGKQQAKQQWGPAVTIVLLCVSCYLTQSAAAQQRHLTQASWRSQSLSLAVTINGPCDAPGYPSDIGATFADCARKDAERVQDVVVVSVVKNSVLGAGAGSCLTQKVDNQTLAGLGVLMRLRGPKVRGDMAQYLVDAGQKRGQQGGLNCDVFITVCLFLADIGATILANNAVFNARNQIAIALPGTLAPPPPPVPGEERKVLKFKDFKYKGAFAIPALIPECNTRTSWSSGGLAMRVKDGLPYFYSTANRSDGATMYEFTYSGQPSLNLNSMPLARITWCGDSYGAARTLTPGSQSRSLLLTHGLHYSERKRRLYWTFGEDRLSTTNNAYFLSYTDPSGIPAAAPAAAAAPGKAERIQPKAATGGMPATGPWRIEPVASGDTALHSQKVRGGALEIPKWFADRYLGGRSLGVGFGGYYYDVMKGMSMGPSLVAVQHPDDGATTGTLEKPIELLGYGYGREQITSRYCLRNNNYVLDAVEYPWGSNPAGNKSAIGYWAPGDSIEGAAAWVDNGTHHGLFFFPQLSMGYIGLSQTTNELEPKWNLAHWYIYDPANLASVARGIKDPWQIQPVESVNMTYVSNVGRVADAPTGQYRRVTGAAYDSVNQTLYVLYLHCGREIVADYDKPFHMMHVFQLKAARGAPAATQSGGSSPDTQAAAAAAAVPEELLAQLQQQQKQQQQQQQQRRQRQRQQRRQRQQQRQQPQAPASDDAAVIPDEPLRRRRLLL